MTVLDAINTRRTIRKFDQEPVSMETLQILADAARQAPTGMNMQPLKFKLIDAAHKDEVFPHVHWAGAIAPRGNPNPGEEPTAYIFILADTNIRKNGYEVDIGIAAENITLAAIDLGLGSCMMGSVDRADLIKMFSIPEHLKLELVIALGKPAYKSVAVPMGDGYKYWLDDEGVLNVPKYSLDDVLV